MKKEHLLDLIDRAYQGQLPRGAINKEVRLEMVLYLRDKGTPNLEIAKLLDVSVKTVQRDIQLSRMRAARSLGSTTAMEELGRYFTDTRRRLDLMDRFSFSPDEDPRFRITALCKAQELHERYMTRLMDLKLFPRTLGDFELHFGIQMADRMRYKPNLEKFTKEEEEFTLEERERVLEFYEKILDKQESIFTEMNIRYANAQESWDKEFTDSESDEEQTRTLNAIFRDLFPFERVKGWAVEIFQDLQTDEMRNGEVEVEIISEYLQSLQSQFIAEAEKRMISDLQEHPGYRANVESIDDEEWARIRSAFRKVFLFLTG